jgi:general secretion pathway protein F
MPSYAYEALDASGRPKQGLIEAETAKAARSALRVQALIPLRVEPSMAATPSVAGAWNRTLWERRAFPASTLGVWTEQLAGLVSSGLPLERALGTLADEAERPEAQRLVAHLRAEVNAGASFAQALAQHPKEFGASYTAVVAAGEQGGQLGVVLEKLADDLNEREMLRSKLISAALYPAIVTVFAFAIVMFLMTYVVPQVAQAFSSGQRALPTITVVMLGISSLVRQWGWLALLLAAGGAVGIAWARRQPTLRLRMDAAWLNLPLLGRLSAGYNGARFAATLAMLCQAGVPILRALQTAADTLHNRSMRADILDAVVLVREGAPLAAALASKKRFPGLLALFARLGEQTGQLPAMLERAALQLSADVQRRALRLATLLEPLLIVAMGVVVLLIVLAVMMPIIQLNQLIK